MKWIIFSLLPPMLWAITNHSEKFLLSKYLKRGQGASIIILSSVLSAVILPFIYYFNRGIMAIPPAYILLLLASGFLVIINYLFYIFALSEEEASVVIPLYQTIPVFSFALGYLFLGEKLSLLQIFSCLLIIIGSILISLDLSGEKLKIKSKILFFMLSASFLASVSGLIFKFIALKEGYWETTFWTYLGEVIIAFILLTFYQPWRDELISVFRKNGKQVVVLNLFNESLTVGASLIYSFATLIAPLALVAVLSNGFQPVFVLLFAVLITLLLPKLGEEKLMKKHLIQKIIAIAIIFVGTYFLNLNN